MQHLVENACIHLELDRPVVVIERHACCQFHADVGNAVRNDILGSGNMARVKANVIVHHMVHWRQLSALPMSELLQAFFI